MINYIQGWLQRVAAMIVLLLVLTGNRVWAQPNFGLGVAASPNPIVITQALTYTINVTNQTSFLLTDVFVTNRGPDAELKVAPPNHSGKIEDCQIAEAFAL